MKITWSGYNSSSRLDGTRPARTIRGAVRAAIRYGTYELYGEGVLTVYADGDPVRMYEAGLLAGTARHDWRRTMDTRVPGISSITITQEGGR